MWISFRNSCFQLFFNVILFICYRNNASKNVSNHAGTICKLQVCFSYAVNALLFFLIQIEDGSKFPYFCLKWLTKPDLKICWFAVIRVCFFLLLLLFLNTWSPWEIFFYHLELEKVALVSIYLTWFSSSSLRSTLCVCFFCNVHTTILNLGCFNPRNS